MPLSMGSSIWLSTNLNVSGSYVFIMARYPASTEVEVPEQKCCGQSTWRFFRATEAEADVPRSALCDLGVVDGCDCFRRRSSNSRAKFSHSAWKRVIFCANRLGSSKSWSLLDFWIAAVGFSGLSACLLSSFRCFCSVLSMEWRPKSYRKASSSISLSVMNVW